MPTATSPSMVSSSHSQMFLIPCVAELSHSVFTLPPLQFRD